MSDRVGECELSLTIRHLLFLFGGHPDCSVFLGQEVERRTEEGYCQVRDYLWVISPVTRIIIRWRSKVEARTITWHANGATRMWRLFVICHIHPAATCHSYPLHLCCRPGLCTVLVCFSCCRVLLTNIYPIVHIISLD